MTKAQQLRHLEQTIADRAQYTHAGKVRHIVPGEGPAHAAAMIIGQNPGQEEDRTGRPFVGRSGKFLTQMLSKMGLDRKQFYITSVVKYATPHNRKPNEKEIKECLPFLEAQILLIRPKVILLLGEVAKRTPRLLGIEYIETVHPAAAMRFPAMRKKFEEGIRRLSSILKRS